MEVQIVLTWSNRNQALKEKSFLDAYLHCVAKYGHSSLRATFKLVTYFCKAVSQ